MLNNRREQKKRQNHKEKQSTGIEAHTRDETTPRVLRCLKWRFSGVGTGFWWEPKPIPNFGSVSVSELSSVGSVKLIISVMYYLSWT